MKVFWKKILYKLLRKNEKSVNIELLSLGSEYGKWKFLKFESLKNATIISAGVGEDVSFDVEFYNLFNGKIIFIDPTPKAISHINNLLGQIGKSKTTDYQIGGTQNISSYDLSSIKTEDIFIYKKALWSKNGKILKFYFPENINYVSNTLIKKSIFQNNHNYIEVETIKLKEIMNRENIEQLELLKLDIEGAEIKVIHGMLNEKIYPKQILVEIDYLRRDTILSIIKTIWFICKLTSMYYLIKIENYDNYLFVRKDIMKNENDRFTNG